MCIDPCRGKLGRRRRRGRKNEEVRTPVQGAFDLCKRVGLGGGKLLTLSFEVSVKNHKLRDAVNKQTGVKKRLVKEGGHINWKSGKESHF